MTQVTDSGRADGRRARSMVGSVNTVLGPRSAKELGITLTHEHLLSAILNWQQPPLTAPAIAAADEPITLANLWKVKQNPYGYRQNLMLDDVEQQIREVELYKRAGGASLVDLTLRDIGRDVHGLAEISRATGISVISGSGFYVHTSHPANMDGVSQQEISDWITSDLTEGIDGTTIKAGVIGEIGTSDPIHPNEEKSLRGAAGAHRRTGAGIVVHTHLFAKWGMRVLDILEQEGVSLDRVALAHVDSNLPQIDYHKQLADRGAYVEFDLFGDGSPIPCDMERIRAIKELVSSGYGSQILIAQDICMKVSLTEYGGYGYSYILRRVLPLMRQEDVADETIHQLLEENPQRFLAWSEPVE